MRERRDEPRHHDRSRRHDTRRARTIPHRARDLGAPVVNSQGDLIGVVSMTDIGRHLAEPSEFASSRRSDFYDIGDDVTLEQDVLEERAVAVRDVMPPWCTMSRPALRSQRRPASWWSTFTAGRHPGQRAGGHHHEHGSVAGRRRTVSDASIRSRPGRTRTPGTGWFPRRSPTRFGNQDRGLASTSASAPDRPSHRVGRP